MTEETQIVVRERGAVSTLEEGAMSLEAVIGQVTLIQEIMDKVMEEGVHYGKIPGTPKPTLLKPGAEKLCITFRMDPEYEIIEKVREQGFIAYTVRCTLYGISSGQRIASGIGSCNSREEKYRWKNTEEMTDRPIPGPYWAAKKAGNNAEMVRLLGGPEYKAKKNEENGQWVIAIRGQRVENDNPWNQDNTFIKIACKRSLTAATLNATAASDMFTQDLEDMVRKSHQDQGEEVKGDLEPPAEKPAPKKPPAKPKAKKEPAPKEGPEPLRRLIYSPGHASVMALLKGTELDMLCTPVEEMFFDLVSGLTNLKDKYANAHPELDPSALVLDWINDTLPGIQKPADMTFGMWSDLFSWLDHMIAGEPAVEGEVVEDGSIGF